MPVASVGRLSRNTNKRISNRERKVWLHPSAGESRSSGWGHVNMLNLHVDLTKSPQHPWACCSSFSSPMSGLSSAPRSGDEIRLRRTTRAVPGERASSGFLRSIACVTRPISGPVYRYISEPIRTMVAIKREVKVTGGVQGCLAHEKGWSSPIARWAPFRFAPFFAALLA